MMPMNSTHVVEARYNKGVGLVEVLVAVVVIAIGMLGIASLYVTSLQAKTTAGARVQAVNLAYDMADRIRANRGAGTAYALSASTALAAPGVACIGAPTANCTAAQMAAADLYQWDRMVNGTTGQVVRGTNGLPGTVTRQITVNGTNPSTYIILLTWGEPSSNGVVQSFQLEVRI